MGDCINVISDVKITANKKSVNGKFCCGDRLLKRKHMKTKMTAMALVIAATSYALNSEPSAPAAVSTPARYTLTAGPITYVDGAQLTFQTFVRMDTTTGQAWMMHYVVNSTNAPLPEWVPVLERFPSVGPTASKATQTNATR
jgi:hypothetical protein